MQINFLKEDIKFLIALKAKFFQKEIRHMKEIKISTLKQRFQRLPIALAHVKVGNTYKNLLNIIRQLIYFLYRAK